MNAVNADAATRVALLARSGVACERLQAALAEAGADVVLVADPSQSDAAGVRAAGAQAILIALDPVVDEALDRYDALLGDPGITVIFDEAELAAKREGWDAARWTRHLSAKLNRHQHVLPPGADPDIDATALGGPAPAPSGLQDAVRMTIGDDLPAMLDDNAIGAEVHGLELPGSFLDETAIGSLDLPRDVPATVSMDETFLSFDPTLAEFDTVPEASSTRLAPVDFELPVFEQDRLSTIESEPGAASGQADNKATKDRFRMDLDALELRIADMQLEELRPLPPINTSGAILVVAGIGGPDAVRQLLSGLPATFPRAVLIQQRLEGARHDNLVRQMQRATAMPVRLAEAGATLDPGHVYVLPTGMGIVAQSGSLHFDGGSDELIARLPSADSAVVLLSGADLSLVDAALTLGLRGSLIAGQSPDGCFDAAASEALVARGGRAAAPADIAKQLSARWPS